MNPAEAPSQGSLSAGSRRLAEWVRSAGCEAELIRRNEPMPTVEAAAAALGVAASRIVKSVVFQHKRRGDELCVAVVPGDARVDHGAVEAVLGRSRLKLASPARVLEGTGYEVGGVPPVGHIRDLPVVLDRSVLDQEEVYGGGGDEWHMLRLRPREIVRPTGAVVAPVLVAGGDAASGDSKGRAPGEVP